MESVTQVLSPFTDFSKIKEDVLTRATERGIAVHRACALVARGLWVKALPEDCQGYVQSFQKWYDYMVVKVIAVEAELKNEAFGYKGHPDLIAILKGKKYPSIIDYKTPVALRKVWKGQLSAYRDLALADKTLIINHIDGVGSLRLHPDGGTAKMQWYEESAIDFNNFLCALKAYRAFKE